MLLRRLDLVSDLFSQLRQISWIDRLTQPEPQPSSDLMQLSESIDKRLLLLHDSLAGDQLLRVRVVKESRRTYLEIVSQSLNFVDRRSVARLVVDQKTDVGTRATPTRLPFDVLGDLILRRQLLLGRRTPRKYR